jgi:hypothetical protein
MCTVIYSQAGQRDVVSDELEFSIYVQERQVAAVGATFRDFPVGVTDSSESFGISIN